MGITDVAGSTGVDEAITQAGSEHVIVAVDVLVITDVISELNTIVMLPEVIV